MGTANSYRLPSAPDATGKPSRVTTRELRANLRRTSGRWVEHKGKKAVHGFKAHVGADADTSLVEKISVTPANMNDGRAGPEALPDDPGEVFADSAYR